MNSTGKELSQADLIHQLYPDGIGPDKQTHLYEFISDKPLEMDFGQEAWHPFR